MLSERDIDAAHPDAFDFVFGNLAAAKRADFNRHLIGCRYCQAVVEEYSEIGGIIQRLPPHVDPPAGLEDRIVGAMGAALAGPRAEPEPQSGAADQGATRVYSIPQPSAVPGTRLHPQPQLQPPEDEPPAPPVVTHLPVWRRYRGRLAAAVAAAAAVITGAIAIPLSLLGSGGPTVAIPLAATTAAKLRGDGAATGRATAHQAGPSWTFQMTVHGLKVLPGNDVYQCWWVGPGSTKTHPQFVSGGTFVVDSSGSTTITMTTGVDPRQFRTMEVTAESPGSGALQGVVLLTGQTL
jgi:Anti-sigma-K factor rskA